MVHVTGDPGFPAWTNGVDASLAGKVDTATANATYAPRIFTVDAPVNNAAVDMPAINVKIALANILGGIVQLQPGTYFISAALTPLANGVIVQGHGPYATVIRSLSLTADFITSTGTFLIGVRDLQLESLIARTAGSGINFTNVEGVVIENVRWIDTYNFGTFTGCTALWMTKIKTASSATGVINRGFWFQGCIDTHLHNVMINGGNCILPTTTAWIQFDSNCDTIVLFDVIIVHSSGAGRCLWFTNTLAGFAPRWVNVNGFAFEGSSAGAGMGENGILIDAILSATFSNGNLATCRMGVEISGGRDIRFNGVKLINNWLLGANLAGTTGPTDVTFTACTFSDNSRGGPAAAPHIFINSHVVSTAIEHCYFGNGILGNVNKVTYAINNNCLGTVVRDCRFELAGFTSGVLTGTNTPTMRDNTGYSTTVVLGPPTVPATTVAYTNNYGTDAMVYIKGGSVTAVVVNGVDTGLISGAFLVPAGTYLVMAYTVAPTWVWIGV